MDQGRAKAGYSKHGKELSCSIKVVELLDQLAQRLWSFQETTCFMKLVTLHNPSPETYVHFYHLAQSALKNANCAGHSAGSLQIHRRESSP